MRKLDIATLRNADGKLLSEKAWLAAKDLDKTENPSIIEPTTPSVLPKRSIAKTRKGKAKMTRKMNWMGSNTEKAARYVVESAPANAVLGLYFGYMLQGGAVKSQRKLQKLFEKSSVPRKANFAKELNHGSKENWRSVRCNCTDKRLTAC